MRANLMTRQIKIIVERHSDGYVAYPVGLEGYYWILYEGGPAEAYEAAGASFRAGGFREHAISAFEKAVAFVERDAGFPHPEQALAAGERARRAIAEIRAARAAEVSGKHRAQKPASTDEAPRAKPERARDDEEEAGSAAAAS